MIDKMSSILFRVGFSSVQLSDFIQVNSTEKGIHVSLLLVDDINQHPFTVFYTTQTHVNRSTPGDGYHKYFRLQAASVLFKQRYQKLQMSV